MLHTILACKHGASGAVAVLAVAMLGCSGASGSALHPTKSAQLALHCPAGSVLRGAGTLTSWCARETVDAVVLHGPFQVAGLNGNGSLVTVQGQFVDDRRSGMWERLENGETQWQGSFKDGVRVGAWQTRLNGDMVSWLEPEDLPKPEGASGEGSDADRSGGCVKADIAATVHAEASLIRACYDVGLAMGPDLAGKITNQWTINPRGLVDDFEIVATDWTSHPRGLGEGRKVVTNALPALSVTRCVSVVMASLRFEPPQEGICVIQWPFIFSPR